MKQIVALGLHMTFLPSQQQTGFPTLFFSEGKFTLEVMYVVIHSKTLSTLPLLILHEVEHIKECSMSLVGKTLKNSYQTRFVPLGM